MLNLLGVFIFQETLCQSHGLADQQQVNDSVEVPISAYLFVHLFLVSGYQARRKMVIFSEK